VKSNLWAIKRNVGIFMRVQCIVQFLVRQCEVWITRNTFLMNEYRKLCFVCDYLNCLWDCRSDIISTIKQLNRTLSFSATYKIIFQQMKNIVMNNYVLSLLILYQHSKETLPRNNVALFAFKLFW
jgi:hypothetical protein